MKKPLMKKPFGGHEGGGQLGAGHGWWRNACVDMLSLDLVRGRARDRVAARRKITFLALGFR